MLGLDLAHDQAELDEMGLHNAGTRHRHTGGGKWAEFEEIGHCDLSIETLGVAFGAPIGRVLTIADRLEVIRQDEDEQDEDEHDEETPILFKSDVAVTCCKKCKAHFGYPVKEKAPEYCSDCTPYMKTQSTCDSLESAKCPHCKGVFTYSMKKLREKHGRDAQPQKYCHKTCREAAAAECKAESQKRKAAAEKEREEKKQMAKNQKPESETGNKKKLFVGNLSWGIDDDDLRDAFSPYGEVTKAKVITDRNTGCSRGFGFVTFANSKDADAAQTAMDGTELDGREINVSKAHAKPAPKPVVNPGLVKVNCANPGCSEIVTYHEDWLASEQRHNPDFKAPEYCCKACSKKAAKPTKQPESKLEDKVLTCEDCGEEFIFSAGEQHFYESKGFSKPKRCKPCRDKKKAAHNANANAKPKAKEEAKEEDGQADVIDIRKVSESRG